MNKTKPPAPRDHQVPRAANVRRIPIHALQAKEIAVLNDRVEQARNADAGVLRAQLALSCYCTAIQHGAGEARPAQILGTEKIVGGKYVLVLQLGKPPAPPS